MLERRTAFTPLHRTSFHALSASGESHYSRTRKRRERRAPALDVRPSTLD